MFREDFVWGVAGGSNQIEGKDVQDMRRFGIRAYRFPVSWSDILPGGTGRINEKKIIWYRDMLLEMKKNGIVPYLIMYDGEFPQTLQDRGGWQNEEAVQWFGEYAKVIAENFSDLCEYFITLDGSQRFAGTGQFSGVHAAGGGMDYTEAFRIAHHVLRAHGQALINLRKYAKRPIRVGCALTCGMAYPAADRVEDIEAARKAMFSFPVPMDDRVCNAAWFADTIFLGRYPEEDLRKWKAYLPVMTQEDRELIAQPLDFMEQHMGDGYRIRAGADGAPEYVDRETVDSGDAGAAAGPATLKCLYWGARFLYERYKLPLYITENNMSCHDGISPDGWAHASDEIGTLDISVAALQRACDDGVAVRGYFHGTFSDKYQNVIRTNGGNLGINNTEHPLLFVTPIFKQMIWGGDRLGKEWGYPIPGNHTGECWAISAHPNGECTIKEGKYAGYTLSRLWAEEPELFGNIEMDRFPLLVKIMDAKEDLSIQVHPDDAYARVNENGSFGKTECWYVLDCKEDSALVVGHNAKTREELQDMVREGKWKELLREIPVKKGDFIQNEPGTVHAIKGGIMIFEIQQSSDITYRLYDYDRLSDGKPRKLHLRESMDVITVPSKSVKESILKTGKLPPNKRNLLIACDYYKAWKLDITEPYSMRQDQAFMIISVIEGDGLLNGRMLRKGDHVILPYEYGEIRLQGNMQLIISAY